MSTENQSYILDYSRLCSDEYGDYIHLVRVLASNFDSTYFDVFDGCLDVIEPRFSTKDQRDLMVSIVPNPNKGSFTVTLNKIISGSLIISDINGREIISKDILESDNIKITEFKQKGVLFISVDDNEGTKIVGKVIITD